MFKKMLVLAVVLGFCVCNAEADQIAVSWDGGGSYNDWDDANNWDPNVVPNNGADTYAVTIDAGTGEVDIGLRQRVTIDQLDCYGEVGLFIGPHDWQNEPVKLTLADPNGLTNYGDLDMSGYLDQLYVWGNVTNTAGANLEVSRVEIKNSYDHGDGNLHNEAGGTIEVEGENDVEGDLHNEGTITIIPGSDLLCEGEFHNLGLVDLYDAECSGDGLFDNSNGGFGCDRIGRGIGTCDGRG